MFFTFLFHTILIVFADTNSALLGPQELAKSHYQEQRYAEAAEIYKSEFTAGKVSATLLYNWAVTEYQMQHYGMAAGLLRKALYLKPEFALSSLALGVVESKLPKSSLHGEKTIYSSMTGILKRISLNQMYALLWLLFAASAFLWIRHIKKYRYAIKSESPLPEPPWTPSLLTVLVVATLLLSILRTVSEFEYRATVITDVEIRTGPDIKDNSIVTLPMGLDLAIRRIDAAWVQIQTPTGISGWAPQSALIQHSGRKMLW